MITFISTEKEILSIDEQFTDSRQVAGFKGSCLFYRLTLHFNKCQVKREVLHPTQAHYVPDEQIAPGTILRPAHLCVIS